jgi:uncharacterized membrane protein
LSIAENLKYSASLLAVLLVGLIAGLLVGTAIDHHRLTVLDAAAWTAARQSIDGVFSRLLPWWWNTTLILLFFAAYLNRGRSRWLFLSAGLLLLFGIVITVVIEVPINKQIASWTSTTVPANWMDLRDRWLAFHNVRSAAGVLAFVFALIGMAGNRRVITADR